MSQIIPAGGPMFAVADPAANTAWSVALVVAWALRGTDQPWPITAEHGAVDPSAVRAYVETRDAAEAAYDSLNGIAR